MERVRVAKQHAGKLLAGRTVWMVNSTALGGGVAQLLRTLLPYWKGAGVDVRWVVLRGSGEFFRVTKRFHNHLQGQPGDGDVLGIEELTTLDRAALCHARALASLVAPGDVVVLNDPQTAAMSEPLARAGATVIWSCHIGIDHDNEYSANAWGVTEAMWKARPVVASAVGGHLEQVQHRHSGLLVADAADVGAFGDAIVELLQEPPRAARLGQTARERVRALFLNDRHFVRWVEVFGSALEPHAGAARSIGPTAGMPAQPSPGGAALDPGDHDALTGLWNRLRFEQELDRARENAERLALLSIDVDRYRDVIRRHGAAAAQGLIQSIAHVLAERLWPNDTLARMGGDEFAAVFHAATPPLIQSLADGLCTAVREQSHATGTNRIPATISIGAAFFDAGIQTHQEALRAADTALHEAKVAGCRSQTLETVSHHLKPNRQRSGAPRQLVGMVALGMAAAPKGAGTKGAGKRSHRATTSAMRCPEASGQSIH